MREFRPFELSIASCGLGHVTRGIETWALDLTNALRQRGIPAGCFRGGGESPHELDRTIRCVQRASLPSRLIRKVVPARIGWRFGLGSPYALEQTTFARRLIALLRDRNVRVLHVQDPLVALAVQQAYQKGRCPTKVILGHGTEEPLEFLEQIEFVQHLAPWHLEQAALRLQHKRMPMENWTAIPNFVDLERFQAKANLRWRKELNIPADAIVILCAAAIKRDHKRIDYLIDEFAQLIRQASATPTWLVIAGAREDETDGLVQQGIQQLGDRVRFLVNVERAKMPSLFQAANLFTLGSLEEMMPIALLEAIASGLPCLIHDRPVMRWMAGPGAIVGDFRESGGWVKAVMSILTSRSRQMELSLAARRHCEVNFSTAAVVDQLLDYYANVLSSPPRRRLRAA